MQHRLGRFTIFAVLVMVGGGVALQSVGSSAPSGGSAATEAEGTATVGEDGTITVTGVALPGQGAVVPAACEGETEQTARVVCAANAFLELLTEAQRAEVLLPLTQENAVRWSNFPTPFGERNGVRLSTLNGEQLAAALAVVYTATGTAGNEGYREAMQIRMADDVVALFDDGGGPPGGVSGGALGGGPDGNADGPPSGGAGTPSGGAGGGAPGGVEFSSGAYFLAFLGTPSTSETFVLQFGGHHLAVNLTYKAGTVAGATPLHTGVEPTAWTSEGVSYAPLGDEHGGMVAMLASLTDEQRAAAQLSETFSDVLLGPGQDGQFPATKAGLAVGSLSDAQKTLVLEAMRPWVRDADDATAAALLEVYEDELDETYIAFSGDPSLSQLADYARIDGPSAWFELACQPSDIDPSGIHYHTIWRDHTRDYGAEFTF